MIIENVTAADMLQAIEELLTIKYAAPDTRATLDKLLGSKKRKTIAIKIDENEPLLITLEPEAFSVTITADSDSDLYLAIPFSDMMGILLGRLPIAAFLKGRLRVAGNPFSWLVLRKLLHVEIGDPESALTFFLHYYMDQ